MPSLSDIPAHLLDASKWDELLDWLVGLPIDWPAARRFIRMWSAVTETHMSAAQWETAQKLLNDSVYANET